MKLTDLEKEEMFNEFMNSEEGEKIENLNIETEDDDSWKEFERIKNLSNDLN